MSASRVEAGRNPKVRRKATRRPHARPAAPDPVSDVARVPAGALRLRLKYSAPLDYKPRTTDLAKLRLEFDDAQVLRYLYRNHAPKRHLELGTREGQGAVYCLEESQQATVWTINLAEDEGSARLVREANLGHRLCQIYCDGRAWDISPFYPYPPGFFDSVLIDGGHDPDTVIDDTRKALILARAGGLVMWHDFCPDPAVFEKPGSPCHGVVAGLRGIWPEVMAKLSDVFWVENTWLLVGVRAAEVAPVAAREAPARAAARARLAAAEGQGNAERAEGEVRAEWFEALGGLHGQIAALRRAQDHAGASLAELHDGLDRAAQTALSDAAARERLTAENARLGAELATVTAAKEAADRLAGELAARLEGVQSQAQGEIARLTAAEAEQSRVTAALRAEAARLEGAHSQAQGEIARLTAAEAEQSRVAATLRAEVARLEGVHSQAQGEIARLTAAEAEQSRVAAALRAELARLEPQLVERAAAADAAEAEALRLSIAESEQRAATETLRAELARRDEAIAALAKQAEGLRRRMERAEGEAARLDGESKARNLKIIDLDALRHVQTKRLEEAEATIVRLEDEGAQSRRMLETALADVSRLESESAHLRQSLADTENSLAYVTRAHEHAASHATALEESIREIRASTSWRVTEPLRRVSTLLHRKGR